MTRRMIVKTETLPVIFRKHFTKGHGWEVTAFFPTLPSSCANWYDLTCYAHVGQHGGACQEFYNSAKKCTPAEFAPLLSELRSIYERGEDAVSLVVYQKQTEKHREARRAEFNRVRG